MANLAANERELHVAVDPNDPNHLAAGANERGGGNSQEWYTSTDGGRNWTSGDLPFGTLTVPDTGGPNGLLMSDPAVDFGANGRIYYSALAHRGSGDPCTLFVTASDDDGANWTDPANGVVAAGTTGPSICNDKEFFLVDRANNDNVYVAWTPFGGDDDQELVFSRDLNGSGDGFAFSAQQVLSTDPAQDDCLNHGAELALEPDGDLYVAWSTFCNGVGDGADSSMWVARSTNQGGSFGVPVQVATLDNVNPPIDPGFRSRSFPSIDADPATGRVFVVWADYTDMDGGDADILLSSSMNNAGWTAPSNVDVEADDGDDQFMPWVDVAQDRVHVAYYTFDEETSNHNVFLSYGDVAATPTFTAVQVNSQPTPANTGFIGDYLAVDVGSDDVAHPTWGDGRAGTGGATDGFSARVDFSPPSNVAAEASPNPLPWGDDTTVTATVTGAHDEAEEFIPVQFAVTSAGTPSPAFGSGTTDASGQVDFVYTNGTAGTDTVTVWADLNEDGVQQAVETTTVMVVWEKHPTVITYTGPVFFANDEPATLSALLTEPDLTPVEGRTVTLTLGTGASAQSCDGVTDATGSASCTIADVDQPLGPGTVTASFAGDFNYLPSETSAAVTVFAWTPGGNFVIGDGNATPGETATFWHDQWNLQNSVSGGPAPASFKGFSNDPSGSTTCGGTWRSTPGNSPPPASELPEYTAVLVTDLVTKSGSTISGTKPMIVVVRVDPGYEPNPGHPGTAEVLGVLCP